MKILGYNTNVQEQLLSFKWFCDINFSCKDVYLKALDLGFNAEKFENKNCVKVFINGIHYKEI